MTGSVAAPEAILNHLDSLPTLPQVVVRLLQVTADSATGAADVVRLLRGDQSLTARILSLANSAAYGLRSPVHTLEQAVPLLGFATVRSVILATTVFETFGLPDSTRARAFDRVEFWKHALAVACCARRLAGLRPEAVPQPEDAFVAGLLHDLGKVALDALFPKAYDRIAAHADSTRGDIADSERSTLGIDHTVAGRRLAERWGLPREYQEVIWLHHVVADALPASVTRAGLIQLVQLADTVAREQRVGYSGNYCFYEYSSQLAERLGVDPERLSEVGAGLAGDVAEHAALLGLDRETSDAMCFKAMMRANAELGRLNAELTARNRRLAAGMRYFKALASFEQRLTDWSNPQAVVSAMAHAAAPALQRSRMVAFGVREDGAAVDITWADTAADEAGDLTRSVGAALANWLARRQEVGEGLMQPAPPATRELIDATPLARDSGPLWLLPIAHRQQVAGGLLYVSEYDERARLAEEADELRSFLASLGLALGRAHAQAAARRLSEDLAQANRRLQQMQAELLRSRTLAMIAEMAAGAGHELNSPLTVISGRAQMLASTLEDPEAQRVLKMISDKAHECSGIVRELMDFARPPPATLAPVNLAEILTELRSEWLARTGRPASQIRLEMEVPPGTPPADAPVVLGDREQLKTVFRELLNNATDALAEDGGSIVLRCRPAARPDALEVTVEDNGCGMSSAVLQRAFDPFFSHRRAGRGRGLGLPRAYRIIEAHAGHIWLESRVDEGTTAHVVLPRAPRAG
jgi:putative nucleotidyltransferase with HDIG domain